MGQKWDTITYGLASSTPLLKLSEPVIPSDCTEEIMAATKLSS